MQFGIGKRRLVRGTTGTYGRSDVRADGRLGDPFPVDAEPEELFNVVRRLPFALGPSFQLAYITG